MMQPSICIVNMTNRVIKVLQDQLENQEQVAEQVHLEKLELQGVLENLVLQ